MTDIVYLDGAYVPRAEARVPVDDRGFVFGDGVYEVTRAIGGRLFAEAQHWARLERGMRELRIDAAGAVDRARVREVSEQLLRRNGLEGGEATVYLQVTRGAAPRTHWFPPQGTPPTVFLSCSPVADPGPQRRNGAPAITLPDLRWARCDLKTISLVAAVLAKQRARESGAFDAILVRDGVVTEGGSTNFFGVLGGTLHTHPESVHILPGVTRAIVLQLARDAGIPVEETALRVDELEAVEEVFLTGTTTDVQPITAIDGRPVGDGAPGPVTSALQRALALRMREG